MDDLYDQDFAQDHPVEVCDDWWPNHRFEIFVIIDVYLFSKVEVVNIFLFVKIQTLWNRSSVEMSDNAWLAAYEAQKAAVLKKIQQKSAPDSSSVSGTSKFSGLVDAKEVGHVVKSNQVTKLLNTLKTKEQSSPVATTVPKSTKPELPSVNRSQSTDKAFTPLTTHLPGPSISAEFQGQILKIILA